MEELEKKLSYESGQHQFQGKTTTWDMKDGDSRYQFRQTYRRVRSDSSADELRTLNKEIKKSDEKLEKLNRKKDSKGRLNSRTSSRQLSAQKDYKKEFSKERRQENKAYIRKRLLFHEAAKALDDGTLETDDMDVSLDVLRAGRNSGRLLFMGSRKLTHTLLEQNSVYRRFDLEMMRNERLKTERQRLSNVKSEKSSTARADEYKKRIKKQQVEKHHRQEQGSFFKRVSESRQKMKKVKENTARIKRDLVSLFTGAGAFLVFGGAAVILLFVVLAMTSTGTSIGASFISMNDYKTMTEGTNYFNDLCTDLYMYLNIDREQLENDISAQLGTDIYEFIYNVDNNISYDQIDLIAYLSAKYGTFTLEMVKAELDDIFAEMFVVEAEIKVEQREVMDPNTGKNVLEDKNICYVTLKVTDFNTVIADRLTEGQKNSYLGYRLSSCGQQVMNPVITEDWTSLISSPFGSRYHPINEEYSMHNGVDIAVPTGTQVYAAVSGVVTAAAYSDSTGYMVSITDINGYTVTYMHLSSYSVAVGQKISAGQMVALSGNSGNSTGPHLHLSVQDAEGNYLNPIFMIPQTCITENNGG